MTFLPIVDRELRVAARLRGTYWSRFFTALTALGLGSWLFIAMVDDNVPFLGQALFIALAILSFLYCLVGGTWVTSDCLSEEKREGTLGLLFLTDLKGYDVVFGKLAATSLKVFYGMLAMFPILALPLLMGGVGYNEFWRVVLISANLLFFSLSAGMFVSSRCRDERRSLSLATLLLLATFCLPLMLGGYLRVHYNDASLFDLFMLPCPGTAAVLAFERNYARAGNQDSFWISLVLTHAYAWICLSLACYSVPRSWQDKPQKRTHSFWQELMRGSASQRQALRTRLLEINPFLWLSARDRSRIWFVWGFLALAALVWVWGYLKFTQDWLNEGTYFITALLLHSALKIWVASEACRRLAFDRASGALELMLSTPLTVPEILSGQLQALVRQFGGAVVAVLLVDCLLSSVSQDTSAVCLYLVGMMIILVVDLLSLSWVSMWLGLYNRKPTRATYGALGRILVLPWLMFFLLATFAGLSNIRVGSFSQYVHLIAWFVLSLGTSVFFMVRSRRNLLERFRDLATSSSSQPAKATAAAVSPNPPSVPSGAPVS